MIKKTIFTIIMIIAIFLHIGHVCMMLVSGYSVRRFNPRLRDRLFSSAGNLIRIASFDSDVKGLRDGNTAVKSVCCVPRAFRTK